jgi:CspA family cold shock protein
MSHTTGTVKWFNNKTGFGFITALDGDHAGKDVFVHHSNMKVAKDQFKYLVQGEYVEFDMVPAEKYEHQAHNVCGIKGGALMCEVQNSAVDGFQHVSYKRKSVNEKKPAPRKHKTA